MRDPFPARAPLLEEAAGRCALRGRGRGVGAAQRIDLQADAVRVGEEDTSGRRALAVRDDPVIGRLYAELPQGGLGATNRLDVGRLERQVVQAGPVGGERTAALLPQRD